MRSGMNEDEFRDAVEAIFNMADNDGDGLLNLEEYCRCIRMINVALLIASGLENMDQEIDYDTYEPDEKTRLNQLYENMLLNRQPQDDNLLISWAQFWMDYLGQINTQQD